MNVIETYAHLVPEIAISAAAGAGAGLLYFYLLRVQIERLVAGISGEQGSFDIRRLFFVLASLLVRMAFMVGLFIGAAFLSGLPGLVAMACGFTLVRIVITKPHKNKQPKQGRV